MKFLTLDLIKRHSRIDFDIEDDLLTLYAESAEETVLNIVGRSVEELHEAYGGVPKPIVQAALMLVEHSYTQRGPVSQSNMYSVPYTFDALVKKYMKLA